MRLELFRTASLDSMCDSQNHDFAPPRRPACWLEAISRLHESHIVITSAPDFAYASSFTYLLTYLLSYLVSYGIADLDGTYFTPSSYVCQSVLPTSWQEAYGSLGRTWATDCVLYGEMRAIPSS